MENEIWKPIPNSNKYETSTEGNVRHIRLRKTLKYSYATNGYPQVKIDGTSKCVHLLMADTFLRFREKHEEVHHKDENKSNCSLSNLEIIKTHNEHLKIHYNKFLLHIGGKMIRLKVEIIDQYGSQRKFAHIVDIHETTMSNILRGQTGISEEYREKIVKALGLSWEELIKEL